MHKHRSKREQLIRTILTFTVTPVIIVSIATMLVLYMLGWRYSISEQQVSQGGLMRFESRPGGVQIKLDGSQLGWQINARQDVSAGTHTVSMERDGYLPWQKTVVMEPGKILWLNYARLIPNDIKTETVETFESLHAALAAPYGEERMLLQPKADSAEFVLVDTSNDTNVNDVPQKEITIPQDIIKNPAGDEAHTFTMQAWDKDGRYVTVSHAYGSETDWLVIDTENPENSQNVDTIIENDVRAVTFDRRNSRAVYGLVDGTLRRVDLSQRNMSSPIITGVTSYTQSDEGVITYVGTQKEDDATSRVIGYYTPGSSAQKIIRKFTETDTKTSLQASITEYANKQYLAVRYGTKLTVSEIRLHPSDSDNEVAIISPTDFMVPATAKPMTVTDDARFVLIQDGAKFVTYDFELKKLATSTQSGDGTARSAQWLDKHILWGDRGGELHMFEFDGENSHNIMEVAPGFDATLSPDGHYIYAIQKTDDGFGLARAQLIIE